ncbi:TetR/AcrR family transcriptional regulator [Spirillospora sp. NPDC050679]
MLKSSPERGRAISDTKEKLLEGALETVRTRGITGVSARAIAAAAGVNQALVFYHFGSVEDLLVAALEHGSRDHVSRYRDRLAKVSSLRELADVGRAISEEEHSEGNFALIGQLLAGSPAHPKLAAATAAGLGLWTTEVESALTRVLSGTPLAEFVDVAGLARAVAASYIGLELYAGVDEAAAHRAMDSLNELAVLVSALDDLGPVVRRAVRAKLRKSAR